MKKIVFLFISLIVFLSYGVTRANGGQCIKKFEIQMDRDGKLAGISWNSSKIYPPSTPPPQNSIPVDPFVVRLPDGKVFPRALSVGTQVTITIDGEDTDTFKIAITSQKSKYELVPIFGGRTQISGATTKTRNVPYTCSFILDESGTAYQIKIYRGELKAENLIFSESLQTRARYYLGSYVGVFYPFNESTEYSLGYVSPSDVNATIMENKLRNVSMIFIGSIYPFGFEPEDRAFSYRRIQLNLATELSSSIFKKIYFGLGYDFTYFSISTLFRFGGVQELQSGFMVGDQVSNSIKTVPTVSKNRLDWGITFCLPLDLMTGWLGKILGLK